MASKPTGRPGNPLGEAGCGALRSSLLMSASLALSPFRMALSFVPSNYQEKLLKGIAVWCVFPALAG